MSNQEKCINELNEKWEKIVADKSNELIGTIKSLQEDNKQLSIRSN
jgi:hypothetical protein